MDGWMNGCKSRLRDSLQQSKKFEMANDENEIDIFSGRTDEKC
jgi:hypothetical protein